MEPGKTKISIRLDNSAIDHFRRQFQVAGGGNYQTLINDAAARQAKKREAVA